MNKHIDDASTLIAHRRLLRQKGFLRKLYTDFYSELLSRTTPKKAVVELGSGAGFIKDLSPEVVTSDVIAGPDIDRVFSAAAIPFPKQSISSFIMVNVLHHLPDVTKTFQEMERCLKVGGKIIMIEPFNSLWSRIVYRNFHHEYFDARSGWQIKGSGRLTGANIALPWIIFVRDRQRFEQKFPHLRIVRIDPHTPFSYLISGGLTRWQFFPTRMFGAIRYFEMILRPVCYYLGMFATIELEKI